MATARSPQLSFALIDNLSLVDDYCQSQLRWQLIGPERSGWVNDRWHYWPHHSGVFYFFKKWAFCPHFNQAWEWDSVFRLRRFDYNIYKSWVTSRSESWLIFKCVALVLVSALIHQRVAASNSLSFWNILTDISATFTWNDLDTWHKWDQNNTEVLNQDRHNAYFGGNHFERWCEDISALTGWFCQCFSKLPRRNFQTELSTAFLQKAPDVIECSNWHLRVFKENKWFWKSLLTTAKCRGHSWEFGYLAQWK